MIHETDVMWLTHWLSYIRYQLIAEAGLKQAVENAKKLFEVMIDDDSPLVPISLRLAVGSSSLLSHNK